VTDDRGCSTQEDDAMQNERDRQPGSSGPQGKTLPAQGETQESVPRAPHERDESADSQAAGEPSAERVGRAAHEDIERGRVDTDEGPVFDRIDDKLREGAGDPAKNLRP
jgi:hypothetical protein